MARTRTHSGTPDLSEWSPFHLNYLAHLLPGTSKPDGAAPAARGFEADALSFLEAQLRDLEGLPMEIPATREQHRYAPGKWSIRELLGHLADAERILGWRALAAARGDQTNILPFEENDYVAIAAHDEIPAATLVSELVAVRRSTLALFATLRAEDWTRRGVSNGNPVSARAWAFAIGAHVELHLTTLRTRYLA